MTEARKYYPDIAPRYNVDGPSVYGEPDPATLQLLDKIRGVSGKVLEVGAGDGRYTHPMLERRLDVVAGDIDEKALDTLVRKTPKEHRDRVHPVIFDAFEPFPFADNQFDAVVSTAFLYLFPKEYIRSFMKEADRVTKKDGCLIVDFVMDRKRTDANGRKVEGENEIQYACSSNDGPCGFDALSYATSDIFMKTESEVSPVDQDLLSTAGYRMKANKYSALYEKPIYL